MAEEKEKTEYDWKTPLIVVGAIIGVSLIIGFIVLLSNSNNNSQNEAICNSPYIKVGNSCCLDQNNNGICDNEESKTYATLSNFYGEIKWIEVSDGVSSYESSLITPCSDGNKYGDIYLEFSLKDMKENIPYGCDANLIEGEEINKWNGRWGGYINTLGEDISGKIAWVQYLKKQHTVQVCCYPQDKQVDEICKTFTLNPYC